MGVTATSAVARGAAAAVPGLRRHVHPEGLLLLLLLLLLLHTRGLLVVHVVMVLMVTVRVHFLKLFTLLSNS